MRALVLSLAKQAGLAPVEKSLDVNDLAAADHVFLTNSINRVVEAKRMQWLAAWAASGRRNRATPRAYRGEIRRGVSTPVFINNCISGFNAYIRIPNIPWSAAMTLMLASVTNPAEAEAVWVGGADIIDLKDPAKGALGALDVGCRGGHRSLGRQT